MAMVMAMDDRRLGIKWWKERRCPSSGVVKLARTGTSRRLVEPTTTPRAKERDSLDVK